MSAMMVFCVSYSSEAAKGVISCYVWWNDFGQKAQQFREIVSYRSFAIFFCFFFCTAAVVTSITSIIILHGVVLDYRERLRLCGDWGIDWVTIGENLRRSAQINM